LQQGTAIITEPVTCTPSVISLLAVTGRQTISVEKLPTVAIITTGNEVMPLGTEVSDVQIRNSNLWLLTALLRKQGITPVSATHIPDDQKKLKQAFEKVMHADIIISCGGVSAGDTDFIPVVLPELGVEKLFHKIAIRPGKPIWCGKRKDGRLIFSLPGNPLSCLVTFTIFIQYYLSACFGLKPAPLLQLPLQGTRTKKTNLDEFFPVQVVKESAMIRLVSFNGSGDIQAALFADGLAIHPYDRSIIENESRLEYINL
jgi:molybdopterin molybdotransferase